MNETQRGVRDDTLLSSRKGSRVMTVDKNKYILSISGMSKSFGRNKVLKHIDLNVKPGTIMGLMGENGAGKSTMMKCLFGTYKCYIHGIAFSFPVFFKFLLTLFCHLLLQGCLHNLFRKYLLMSLRNLCGRTVHHQVI